MKNSMMDTLNAVLRRYRQLGQEFWQVRSEQERTLLSIGGVLLVLALVYTILIDPAVSGRAKLQTDLPLLRQEAAEIEALAQQAQASAKLVPAPVPVMSRASLTSSLAGRGLTAQSIGMTADFAKVQLSGVPFAALLLWLDALRHESRIAVDEASITAQSGVGLVDATLTLHQSVNAAP